MNLMIFVNVSILIYIILFDVIIWDEFSYSLNTIDDRYVEQKNKMTYILLKS